MAGLPRGLPHPLRDSDGRFRNPWLTASGRDPTAKPGSEFLALSWYWVSRWIGEGCCCRPPDPFWGRLEPLAVDWGKIRSHIARSSSRPLAVWLGHASVLVVCRGRVAVFDPVFSRTCGPIPHLGIRRMVACPLRPDLSDWPEDVRLDVVAVSHAHYDHLDVPTVKALRKRFPSARFVAPLGLGPWFESVGVSLDAELDWWQETDGHRSAEVLGGGLGLVALPAQHWANRCLCDRNKTLWCAYGIVDKVDDQERTSGAHLVDDQELGFPVAPQKRSLPFFFSGDTAYHAGFAGVGSMFSVGIAALPMGAYTPEWFMSVQHANPGEAVQMMEDLKAEAGLGIHWGTFELTSETPLQQLTDLAIARRGDLRLRAVLAGGHVAIGPDGPTGSEDLAVTWVEMPSAGPL